MDLLTVARRELFKVSGMGLAAAALPAYAIAAASESNRGTGLSGVFDVRAYGATGDGKTVDTPAINKAIEAAAATEGIVLFSPGTYVCFSIRLRSKVHLVIPYGAVILAADSPLRGQTTGYQGGTYDPAESNAPWEKYQDYRHNHWQSRCRFDVSTGSGSWREPSGQRIPEGTAFVLTFRSTSEQRI
jgi:hypothetical protein